MSSHAISNVKIAGTATSKVVDLATKVTSCTVLLALMTVPKVPTQITSTTNASLAMNGAPHAMETATSMFVLDVSSPFSN